MLRIHPDRREGAVERQAVIDQHRGELGHRGRGDDIVGLSRAFLAAGARNTVATLWTVDDFESAELMKAFYQYLALGYTVAHALGLAQTDVRRDHPNPFYWAGFTLNGLPDRKVVFKDRTKP